MCCGRKIQNGRDKFCSLCSKLQMVRVFIEYILLSGVYLITSKDIATKNNYVKLSWTFMLDWFKNYASAYPKSIEKASNDDARTSRIKPKKIAKNTLRTCKANVYLCWIFPILYNKTAAERNSSTNSSVLANSSSFCFER